MYSELKGQRTRGGQLPLCVVSAVRRPTHRMMPPMGSSAGQPSCAPTKGKVREKMLKTTSFCESDERQGGRLNVSEN